MREIFAGVLIVATGCSRHPGSAGTDAVAPPVGASAVASAVASPSPLTLAPTTVASMPIDLGAIPPNDGSRDLDMWPDGIIASSDGVFLAFSATLDHGDRDMFAFAQLARYSPKGSPRSLTNVDSGPDIARLGRRLYFADKEGIGWVDVAGGSPTEVTAKTGTLVGASATEVFVQRDTLAAISVSGVERTIATLPSNGGPGVVTKTHFYAASRSSVVRVALSDGTTDRVAEAPPAGFYYRELASSADEVVATLWEDVPGGREKVLYSVTHEMEIVRAPDLLVLAVGRKYVYVVKGQNHVEVVRVPLAGGAAEVLFETDEPPHIGAAGGGLLVWATEEHVRAISIPDSP